MAAQTWWEAWREKWRRLSAKERWLLVGSLVYVVSVAVYVLVWHGAALKYGAAMLGFALLPLLPELIREKRQDLLVALVAAVAIGNTGMQLVDDHSKDQATEDLKQELQTTRLLKWRDLSVKEAEARLRNMETVTEVPLDAVGSLVGVEGGFLRKADRLSVSAALEESRLLAAHPDLARRILALPRDPKSRLSTYEAMGAAAPEVSAVIFALRHEVGYRESAQYLAREAVPVYQALEKDIEAGKLDRDQVVARLREVEDRLAAPLAAYPVAGLLNHAGLLAMAQRARQRALGRYYSAVAADSSHIPAYESVAYASWTNQETRTAVRYAEMGLVLAEEFPKTLASEHAQIARNYTTVAQARKELAPILKTREREVSAVVARVAQSFQSGRVNLRKRLELLYAYCSALDTENESRAREYAEELHKKDPKDAEYQDALGLVLLMFARNARELDRSDALFTLALDNRKSEQMTKQLAGLHRSKVEEKRNALRLGK